MANNQTTDWAAPREDWIECDCPVVGGDFDVWEIVGPDTIIHCAECGGDHRIGDIGQFAKVKNGNIKWLTEAQWKAEVAWQTNNPERPDAVGFYDACGSVGSGDSSSMAGSVGSASDE